MKRRTFINRALWGTGSLLSYPAWSQPIHLSQTRPKISLAQWSLHRAYEADERNPVDFAMTASDEFGINAVEYVAGFYSEQANDLSFWQDMNKRAEDAGVENLLIMVDGEGLLGDENEKARQAAVKNHYKWVDAAKALNCHSIRVNAFGNDDRSKFRNALMKSLSTLCGYAADKNIDIIIENHGLFSSEAPFIAGIIKELNLGNLGTLPDFGNWCTSVQWGSIFRGECEEAYDKYEGVKAYMPFARGVSAKSYDFAEDGSQPLIDYQKMFRIVKAAGYTGFVGVEYEGNNLSEEDGIRATKKLIERTWSTD